MEKNNKLYYNMNKTFSYNSVYTAEEGGKTRRRDGKEVENKGFLA